MNTIGLISIITGYVCLAVWIFLPSKKVEEPRSVLRRLENDLIDHCIRAHSIRKRSDSLTKQKMKENELLKEKARMVWKMREIEESRRQYMQDVYDNGF